MRAMEVALDYLKTFILMYYDANSALCLLMLVIFLWKGETAPQLIRDIFLYGKYSTHTRAKTILQSMEVPKQWFTHFYLCGSLMSSAAIAILLLNFWNIPVPENWLTLLVVHSLVFFQVARRYYECRFVSIFSEGTMNSYHYFMGMFFYISLTLGLFLDAGEMYSWNCFQLMGFTTVMLSLQYQQMKVSITLASLRRSDKGNVIHRKHVIPHGGLFEWVSSPHYLLEILIYTVIMCIVGPDSLYYRHQYVFVLANQLLCSVTTHAWYRKQFPQYPSQRRVLIPFLL